MRYEFSFPIPDKPWSTNEDRNLNPYARAARISVWKEATQLGWASYRNRNKLPKVIVPSIVHVTIPFKQRRRRDPHNYCGTVVKAILDGLVLAGCWKDDTPDFVKHIEPTLFVGGAQDVLISTFPLGKPAHFMCNHDNFGECPTRGCSGGWKLNL